MELAQVRGLGESLLAEHGLTGWTFGFDNARRRAGLCGYGARRITVSRTLMALYSHEQVRETILHEVAHALAGAEHGHDAAWRAVAERIGSTGARLVAEDAPRAPAPWVGRCPAGHTVGRYRRPTAPLSCRRCAPRFSREHLLTWTYRGRQVRMPTSYERALRALDAQPAAVGPGTRRSGPTGGTPATEEGGTPSWDGEKLPGYGQAPWDEDDDGRPAYDEAAASVPRALAAAGILRAGARVRIAVRGKYAGLVGTVEKVGRTRYHVRTGVGLLAVSFAGVEPLDVGAQDR